MFELFRIAVGNDNNVLILFDEQTKMPLFYPLMYSIDRLNLRSVSTQESTLRAIKFFYNFWLCTRQKKQKSLLKQRHNSNFQDESDHAKL